MKKLLQNKRLLAIIGGAVTLIFVILIVYVTTQDKPPVSNPVPETSASTPDTSVTIELPENSETPDIPGNSNTNEIPDDGTGLKPNENISIGSGKTNTGEKAQEPASPAKETDSPKNTDNSNGGGIQIGDGDKNTKYNCGSPKHHCEGAETHAYILNLELEGCLYCGSHACPSFYAVDEWGNACYTPSKCPQYDKKKDAVEYCQTCGKKNGNGDNNTCQKWIIDFTCPICGKLVKANECHTH